ncbi:hypothetical protein FQR65_LT10463 [Abscondita terminalis]|nr:hypothetical protein FQR65_LT10463 [Abscondita terminalis]
MAFFRKVFYLFIVATAVYVGVRINSLFEIPPIPNFENEYWGPGAPIKDDTAIRTFEINVPDQKLRGRCLCKQLSNIINMISKLLLMKSAKILGVFPYPAYSHYLLGDRIFKELSARGHEVTVISPYKEANLTKNFKQVLLTNTVLEAEALRNNLFADHSGLNVIQKTITVDLLGLTFSEKALNDQKVQEFLQTEQEFDAVIVHQFATEAYKGFCNHFRAPCISVVTMLAPNWVNPQTGNPGSPAYIPETFVDFSSDMNFLERCYNTFVHLTTLLVSYIHTLPKHNQLLQKYFPSAPNIYDLYYNSSLVLINSHVSLTTTAVPLLPNIIEVAGYHVKTSKKLPNQLQLLLDNAHDGVIYFSLGSNLKSKDLPIAKRNVFLKVFAKLKQTVLWKWEQDTLTGKSDNVIISKWLPQQDVLAHPNVKLFISHGGLLSVIETVYHGVPLLGIPVFGDQDKNLNLVQKGGYGLSISYNELSESILINTINHLLNDTKFAQTAKERSKIMHDEPMKPLEKAIFWIEYVIRHRGAPHLRSPALNLSWYQYFLLDVSDHFFKSHVHVVMGNESCDLDSMVSALALAYLHYKINPSKLTVIVPVLNILSKDLLLRTENCYVLNQLNIDRNLLIFRDTIDLEEILKRTSLKLSIVDHHVLRDQDKFLQQSVVEVFDHRPRDPQQSWDCNKTKIVIDQVGSCASLITNEILKQNGHILNESLASLLYDTIIFDTIGFKPEAEKVTKLDLDVSKELEKIIKNKKDPKERYEELWALHNDVSHLTPKQLLSKDLKFIHGLPIPGLPMLVRDYLRLPNAANDIELFSNEVNHSTVVLMGLSVLNNEVHRDIGIFAASDKSLRDTIVTTLKGLEEFSLEEVNVTVGNVIYFKQNNITKSRKHLLPIIKSVLEKHSK